jgi:hypothetical protein
VWPRLAPAARALTRWPQLHIYTGDRLLGHVAEREGIAAGELARRDRRWRKPSIEASG